MIANKLALQENNTSGSGEFLVLDELNANNILGSFPFDTSNNSRNQALNQALTLMSQTLGKPGGGNK